MKLPTFDMNHAFWDKYKTFYIPHGPSTYSPGTGAFIQLHTGELMIKYHNYHPDQRRLFSDLNIQIVSTKDDNCPKLYRPSGGRAIPKAHLNWTGQQVLLVDWDHSIAVCVGRPNRGKGEAADLGLTERWESENFIAWYKGEKSKPIGQPIIVEYDYQFSPEQREHIQTIHDACQTWYKMQDKQLSDSETQRLRRENDLVSTLGLCAFEFGELTDQKRTMIALQDLDRGTAIEVLDHVIVGDKDA